MANSASTVPPFIPGLLIVSLLIVISILIGWRNYIRRGNPRLLPGMGEWAFWEPGGTEGVTTRPQKPKLWEVGVGRTESEKAAPHVGWEKIMPLSAMPIGPEPPPSGSSQPPQVLQSQANPHPPSRLPRLSFLSSAATPTPPSPPPSPPPPEIPLHRLQVSVLISMPSLPTRARSRLRNSLSSSSPLPLPTLESDTDFAQRASSSLSIRKDVVADHDEDEEEEEGAPEVAFGVTVLPWRKAEDEDEKDEDEEVEVEQSDIMVNGQASLV